MLRKQIIKGFSAAPVPTAGAIDIAAAATILVTSESPEQPWITSSMSDEARGGRWVSGVPGGQT
jgi:hypothetical protein